MSPPLRGAGSPCARSPTTRALPRVSCSRPLRSRPPNPPDPGSFQPPPLRPTCLPPRWRPQATPHPTLRQLHACDPMGQHRAVTQRHVAINYVFYLRPGSPYYAAVTSRIHLSASQNLSLSIFPSRPIPGDREVFDGLTCKPYLGPSLSPSVGPPRTRGCAPLTRFRLRPHR